MKPTFLTQPNPSPGTSSQNEGENGYMYIKCTDVTLDLQSMSTRVMIPMVLKRTTRIQHTERILERAEYAYKLSHENSKRSSSHQKKWYDEDVQVTSPIAPGDRILVLRIDKSTNSRHCLYINYNSISHCTGSRLEASKKTEKCSMRKGP